MGRNVRGAGAIVAAVEQLRREELNIRRNFVKDGPSKDNTFVQSQADIIVDQLNYGRYEALAREGMMLEKPVVGRVNNDDGDELPATSAISKPRSSMRMSAASSTCCVGSHRILKDGRKTGKPAAPMRSNGGRLIGLPRASSMSATTCGSMRAPHSRRRRHARVELRFRRSAKWSPAIVERYKLRRRV
jgi:hypothetical protein